jgi:hypothetical protein
MSNIAHVRVQFLAGVVSHCTPHTALQHLRSTVVSAMQQSAKESTEHSAVHRYTLYVHGS